MYEHLFVAKQINPKSRRIAVSLKKYLSTKNVTFQKIRIRYYR